MYPKGRPVFSGRPFSPRPSVQTFPDGARSRATIDLPARLWRTASSPPAATASRFSRRVITSRPSAATSTRSKRKMSRSSETLYSVDKPDISCVANNNCHHGVKPSTGFTERPRTENSLPPVLRVRVLWLEQDLHGAVLLVLEDLVRVRRLLQRQLVRGEVLDAERVAVAD